MKKLKLAAAAIFITGSIGAVCALAQHGGHGGGNGGGQMGQQTEPLCPLKGKDYTAAAKNTESGAEITLTAKSPRDIPKLRASATLHFSSKSEMDRNCPARIAGSTTTVEEADGGVRIIITAKAPAAIMTVQAAAAYACKSEAAAAKRVFKTYVCPMGDFQSSRPGRCPKCGMELVEKK